MAPLLGRTNKWTSPDKTAVKTLIWEGDLSAARPRLGATGEIEIVLNSIDGLRETETEAGRLQIPSDVQRSRYFCTESKACDFEIGAGTTAVDRAFEKHLTNIQLKEKCNLVFNVVLEENYNQRTKTDSTALTISLDCDVHLLHLLNAEPIHKWYPETKLEKARQVYSQAVLLFKAGRYLDSFHLFQSGYKLSVLAAGLPGTEKHSGDLPEPELVTEAKRLCCNCCNNLAACHFQWGNHRSVIQLSSKVIEADVTAVKALYRRGVSYLSVNEYDFSERDLVAAHKLDPSNRAVNEKLGQVKQRRKASQSEMKNNLCKMFR